MITHIARPRRLAAAFAAALFLTSLTACGGDDEAPPPNQIAEGTAPDYYPAGYADIIAGSKAEGGELTIYSNTDQENWAPIFRDFQKKYPWVTKINANNLDSDEVFQRVLSEQATGSSPADLLVSNAAQAWAEYAEGGADRLMAYQSPELAKLPQFATLMPNVYAMSTDPMTIAYNTSLVEKAPTGLASLAEIVAADPNKVQGQDHDPGRERRVRVHRLLHLHAAQPGQLGQPGEAAAAGPAGDLLRYADGEDPGR